MVRWDTQTLAIVKEQRQPCIDVSVAPSHLAARQRWADICDRRGCGSPCPKDENQNDMVPNRMGGRGGTALLLLVLVPVGPHTRSVLPQTQTPTMIRSVYEYNSEQQPNCDNHSAVPAVRIRSCKDHIEPSHPSWASEVEGVLAFGPCPTPSARANPRSLRIREPHTTDDLAHDDSCATTRRGVGDFHTGAGIDTFRELLRNTTRDWNSLGDRHSTQRTEMRQKFDSTNPRDSHLFGSRESTPSHIDRTLSCMLEVLHDNFSEVDYKILVVGDHQHHHHYRHDCLCPQVSCLQHNDIAVFFF
jgi:hypothetical protein